jgi:hypothetical protein
MLNNLSLADWRVGRLMSHFGTGPALTISWIVAYFCCESVAAEQRLLDFAGQPNARLDKNQAIYDVQGRYWQVSWLTTILAPLLFFAPVVHLKNLEVIYTGHSIHKPSWRRFTTKLQDEWREFVLYVRHSNHKMCLAVRRHFDPVLAPSLRFYVRFPRLDWTIRS